MANNNYIVAIEVGSSKISGVVGIHTYLGIKILAYASETVNGFITKGVVRNIDETGSSLSTLINRLETQLNNISIEKAYIAFGGLSMHSQKSSVVREFDEYTKITQDIIDEMRLENDATFIAPDGFNKIQMLPLECKLNGDKNMMPIGIPTRRIECNYLNIVMREQYMKQLEESFKIAKITIADNFCTARIEADTILSEDERICDTALVDIGAESTTVAIYSNKLMRKLVVIPIGSSNITKDICSEQISYNEAEQMKIFKGYRSEGDDNSALPTEVVDQIISARMTEILLNVKHQIETSEQNVRSIVLCGGGTKLKNIKLIIDEVLTNFKVRIATDFDFAFSKDERLEITTGAITPTLFGLLQRGKENCCREEVFSIADNLFENDDNIEEERPVIEEEENSSIRDIEREEEEKREREEEEKRQREEEEKRRRDGEKKRKEEEKKRKEEENKIGGFFKDLFDGWSRGAKEFVENITEEESEDTNKDKSI